MSRERRGGAGERLDVCGLFPGAFRVRQPRPVEWEERGELWGCACERRPLCETRLVVPLRAEEVLRLLEEVAEADGERQRQLAVLRGEVARGVRNEGAAVEWWRRGVWRRCGRPPCRSS